MKPDFSELHKRGQENLIRFLRTEVELAHTFLKMSETTQSPDHRTRLIRTVQEAVQTIDRFENRIADESVRAELIGNAGKLKVIVASLKTKSNRKGAPKPTRNRTAQREISSRQVRPGNLHSA